MTALNADFWAAIASAWDRSITPGEVTATTEAAARVAVDALGVLAQKQTYAQIQDAIAAVLDDNDEAENDW